MSKNFVLQERTYVTPEGEIAGEKHKGRKHLLGGKGQKIPYEKAVELGLVDGEKPAAKKDEKPAAK